MSYVICGFRCSSTESEFFEKCLLDAVPPQRRVAAVQRWSDEIFITIYGGEKSIPDVDIADEETGSWITIFGTPLLRFSTGKKKELLTEFLSDPCKALCSGFDGSFAALCYDAGRNILYAATDFNNTIPIFYSVTPRGVLLSTHELALAKYIGARLDPLGFSHYIHLGTTWGSRSRFEKIHKMLPCQVFTFGSAGVIEKKTYFNPEQEGVWQGNFDELLEEWAGVLKDSVWKFYEASGKRPVLSDLTGGEDSRLLVAACHALGIPFKTQVIGVEGDSDVTVARKGAREAGFELMVRERKGISKEDLLNNATSIVLQSDGYDQFFSICTAQATDIGSPLDDYKNVKYNGYPGYFKGSYYHRGKVLFPSKKGTVDWKFFTKMKYLLDYYPGLVMHSDKDFLESVYGAVEENVQKVKKCQVGTQIDHLIREFQTCVWYLKYKNPLYLPYATKDLTRSLYYIPAAYKKRSRLTRACTEKFFHELAWVKTQKGVPTVRRTMLRAPLFFPEYFVEAKSIWEGAWRRLFKWKENNKWYSSQDRNSYVFRTLFNEGPYEHWFSSSKTLVTGDLFNANVVDPLLAEAKSGRCRYVQVLGRIINMELASRWVYGEGSG